MKLEKGDYSGVYRGIVTSNKDPHEIGRIQVRVPFLHGTSNHKSFIEDKYLPYALPCMPFASHDAGTLLVPEVGSMVFVMFEDGDSKKPIYIGQMFSKGSPNAVDLKYTDSNLYKATGSRTKLIDIDDTPKSAYKDGILKRLVLFKSIKGATIQVNDCDEEESFEFYDRSGQAFIMHSPNTIEDNEDGINNRGIFSVLKSQFNRVIKLPAYIILKSLSGSYLQFTSTKDHSDTSLVNIYNDKKSGIQISIGQDNRLLIFYNNTKFELSDDRVNITSKSINMSANSINMSANTISSSSNIHIGGTRDIAINDSNHDELRLRGVD